MGEASCCWRGGLEALEAKEPAAGEKGGGYAGTTLTREQPQISYTIAPATERIALPSLAGETARGGLHLRPRGLDHLLQPTSGSAVGTRPETERSRGPLLRLVQVVCARRIADRPRP